MKKTSVLIADDHKLLREVLSFMINEDPEFEVVASCGDSSEAIELTLAEKPGIVLMDINMGPLSGIEATGKLKDLCPSSLVIGMSIHTEPVYVKKMLKMGARGYVTKNSPRDEIMAAMKKVNAGDIYVCQEIKDILGEQLCAGSGSTTGIPSLTEREIQVVEFIKNGGSSKEIAVAMGIKLKTVEVHRHNILQKLKLKNSAALVAYCHNNAHCLVSTN